MSAVPEEVIVWEYLRWDGKYRNWLDYPLLKTPNFGNPDENRLRWDLLAGNQGLPGDFGQVLRIRYPFERTPAPYRWVKRSLPKNVLPNAFLNYTHLGQLLKLDNVVAGFLKTGKLPYPFNSENTLVVQGNLERLKKKADTGDFDAILFCRPTPDLPKYAYRIVGRRDEASDSLPHC